MNTMKRIIVTAAALTLGLGTAACGTGPKPEGNNVTAASQPPVWDQDPGTHVHVSAPVILEGTPACQTRDGHGDGDDWQHVCYWDPHDGSPAYLLVDGVKVASWKR